MFLGIEINFSRNNLSVIIIRKQYDGCFNLITHSVRVEEFKLIKFQIVNISTKD